MRASVGRTLYLLKTLHFQRICPTNACTKPSGIQGYSNLRAYGRLVVYSLVQTDLSGECGLLDSLRTQEGQH